MPFYWTLLIAVALLSMSAQMFVKSNYSKYSRIRTTRGMTGAEVAQYILNKNDIYDVKVVKSRGGTLSDHFDPAKKIVALSPDIYNGTSIASVAVAAHEVGHAIQYATGYQGIKLRNAFLKPTIVASQFSQIAIFIGLVGTSSSSQNIFTLGIYMIGIITLFQVLTLPIEFDASARALRIIKAENIVDANEYQGAKKMLQAAALTYVAAVIGSIANLLYYIALRDSKNRN